VTENREKNTLKREEMQLKRDLKNQDVIIAKENKNQYDSSKTSDSDKKK
jgi:hypothetical protein